MTELLSIQFHLIIWTKEGYLILMTMLNFDTFLTISIEVMPTSVLHFSFSLATKNIIVGVPRDGQKISTLLLGRMAPIGLFHWPCLVTWEQ